MLRTRARLAEVPFDEDMMGLSVPSPGDGDLTNAMAQLPARYREVLLLRYDTGYSTREIAALFGVSQAAAQKLLTRAKDALRKQLE